MFVLILIWYPVRDGRECFTPKLWLCLVQKSWSRQAAEVPLLWLNCSCALWPGSSGCRQCRWCVLDLSNKGFISISLAPWIYKPYSLNLLVLQWIKTATVYSPSHPRGSATITAQRVTTAFNSLPSQWHPWLFFSLDHETMALQMKKRDHKQTTAPET